MLQVIHEFGKAMTGCCHLWPSTTPMIMLPAYNWAPDIVRPSCKELHGFFPEFLVRKWLLKNRRQMLGFHGIILANSCLSWWFSYPVADDTRFGNLVVLMNGELGMVCHCWSSCRLQDPAGSCRILSCKWFPFPMIIPSTVTETRTIILMWHHRISLAIEDCTWQLHWCDMLRFVNVFGCLSRFWHSAWELHRQNVTTHHKTTSIQEIAELGEFWIILTWWLCPKYIQESLWSIWINLSKPF